MPAEPARNQGHVGAASVNRGPALGAHDSEPGLAVVVSPAGVGVGRGRTPMADIQLRSPSFGDHQPIPARHAKDHENLSPALEWSGVPEAAVELAVLCEDPR
jgi:hypothetical protein